MLTAVVMLNFELELGLGLGIDSAIAPRLGMDGYIITAHNTSLRSVLYAVNM